MAKAEAPSAPVAKKRIQVLNLWNQVVSIVLSDGTEYPIKSKGSVNIDSDRVSEQINRLQTRGIIRLKMIEVAPEKPVEKAASKA